MSNVRSPTHVTFAEALRVWARIGLLGFGGPAGQVALMHRELVEERKWVDEARFLHALNYCMLLPGPEATQLAVYIGWLMHRTAGGIAAGVLFVLPGFASILALSILYAAYREVPLIDAALFGLKAAVLAVVIEAVLRIGKRALEGRLMFALAALAFVAIFFLGMPFPLIVLGAGVFGYVGSRVAPDAFPKPAPIRDDAAHTTVVDRLAATGGLAHTAPSSPRAVRILVVCLLLWMLPVAALALVYGTDSVFVIEGIFFSKAAVVTFGGAYAVLAYIAQRAVETYGWLEPGEMLDGLGLAETTPGPLIMVVQFVGFLGAYRNPGPLWPMAAGVLGSLVTVWVTFVPCFLWIFLGAPYIEALRGNRSLHAALSCITAAVVGVVLNLSVWFAVHTLFAEVLEHRVGVLRLLVPVWSSIDLAATTLAAFSMIAMFRFHLSMPRTLAASAALGMLWRFVSG